LESQDDAQAVLSAANDTIGVGNVLNEIVIIEASSSNANSFTPEITQEPVTTAAATKGDAAASITTAALNDSELAQLAAQRSNSNQDTSTIGSLTDRNSTNSATAESSINNTQLALLDESENQTPSNERAKKSKPSLNIRVFDKIVSIDGLMSSDDDTSSLIQDALNSFDKEVVSNGIKIGDDIEIAQWLEALKQIMPLMSSIEGAQIGIAEEQILSLTKPWLLWVIFHWLKK